MKIFKKMFIKTLDLEIYELIKNGKGRLPNKLTDFDKEVCNAIFNFVKNEKGIISLNKINEKLTVQKGDEQERLKEIMDSVEKIATTWVEIDYNGNILINGIEKTQCEAIGGNLIPMNFIEIESKREIDENTKENQDFLKEVFKGTNWVVENE